MSLTPKQEKFCQGIVSGMTYKDAYLAAYEWNGTDNGAYVEANLLLKREDIQQRIESLKIPIVEAIQKDVKSDYDKIKAIAWERLNLAIDRQDDITAAKYIEILNKMTGSYVNINHNINDNKPELITALNTSQLKKLLE